MGFGPDPADYPNMGAIPPFPLTTTSEHNAAHIRGFDFQGNEGGGGGTITVHIEYSPFANHPTAPGQGFSVFFYVQELGEFCQPVALRAFPLRQSRSLMLHLKRMLPSMCTEGRGSCTPVTAGVRG